MIRACVALALLFLNVHGCSESSRSGADVGPSTPFVVLGHIRELPDDVLALLAERINAENPDYVFVLGDLTFAGTKAQTDRIQRAFLDRLGAPFYLAPGNHDRVSGIDAYRDWVGYRYKVILDRNANFLLIDSSDDSIALIREVEALLERADPARPTILLTHHHVWKRHLKVIGGKFVRRRHTRVFWKALGARFRVGFAGDAVRDFSAQKLGGRHFYSVGVFFSGRCRPIYFARAEVNAKGRLRVRPIYLDLPGQHPWHTRRLPTYQPDVPWPIENSASATGGDGELRSSRCEGRGATIRLAPSGPAGETEQPTQ